MGKRLVVIGGDAAGGSAAAQARKRQRDLDVVMFERGRATSYSACGIPYWISGAVEDEATLIARTPDQHRAAGIDVRIRTEVVGIDLDRRGGSRRGRGGGGGRRAGGGGGGGGPGPLGGVGRRRRRRADPPAGARDRRDRGLRRA